MANSLEKKQYRHFYRQRKLAFRYSGLAPTAMTCNAKYLPVSNVLASEQTRYC
jgi:hypothetical protein